MSFQAMTWAVDVELPTNQKMVLLMLANRTNHDTGRCDPSHSRLAKDCGMSPSTLKRCLKSLEDIGLIEIVNRKVGDVNLPNQYKLNMNWVGSQRTEVSSQRTEVGSQRAEGVGSQWPTNHEFNNQELNQELNHDIGASAESRAGDQSHSAPAKKKSSNKVSMPEDFKPTAQHYELAKKNGVNLDYEFEQFKDHHAAKQSKFADWHAALRTWIRNAAKFSKPKNATKLAGYINQDYSQVNYHEGVDEDGRF